MASRLFNVLISEVPSSLKQEKFRTAIFANTVPLLDDPDMTCRRTLSHALKAKSIHPSPGNALGPARERKLQALER